MEKSKKWLGSEPRRCDICRHPFGEHFYDARTRDGRWGLLCRPCFEIEGVGLGTGKGQKYRSVDKVKVEG